MIRQSKYQSDRSHRVGKRHKKKGSPLKFLLPADQAAECEYKELVLNKSENKFLSDSTLRCNCTKNRYEDVLPLEATAVRLNLLPDIVGSDYINANYVSDRQAAWESKKQQYICTQAPQPNTFVDFWRMVWEQDIPLIVMLTNLIEKNQVKADMYWPGRTGEVRMYGRMRVKLISQRNRGALTIRRFDLWQVTAPSSSSEETDDNDEEESCDCYSETSENIDEDCVLSFSSSSEDEEAPGDVEVRSCIQVHCTKWPDFGVLKSLQLLKDLIREIDIHKTTLDKPLLVHCSAGIGRTGTLIAILSSLHRELLGEVIDVKKTVEYLRTKRLGMVQSTAQYKFIYEIVANLLVLRENFCHLAAHTMLQGVWAKKEHPNPQLAKGEKSDRLLEVKEELQSSVHILQRYKNAFLRTRSQSWHGQPSPRTKSLSARTQIRLRRRSEGRKKH
eukprot:TRINITY_DN8570_c0_g1_i1.p1 TRINITY_DN8570_c0_g1~~TRINITY_DN8570_c0_g1_i1.p1  ORF type:complete len:445 (+),score=45.54 TRINITY_DN8570_c0_g1_i1:83-1417(+)